MHTMADVDALVDELTCGDDRRAEASVEPLSLFGQPALERILRLLAVPSVEARWWATRALAAFDAPAARAALRRVLHDTNAPIRHCAALGLRLRPSADAIPDLLAALASSDRLLARLAADALAAVGADAIPALAEVCRAGDPAARIEAARALAAVGDPQAVPALFAALDDPSSLVEFWAERGLERLGVGMVFVKP
jgi:HEAT repeat protein